MLRYEGLVSDRGVVAGGNCSVWPQNQQGHSVQTMVPLLCGTKHYYCCANSPISTAFLDMLACSRNLKSRHLYTTVITCIQSPLCYASLLVMITY